MTKWMAHLNELRISDFQSLYSDLQIPSKTTMDGFYKGTFVGPAWLRKAAGPALVMTGLGGWWGKQFYGDGTAYNLVKKDGELRKKFPMKLVDIHSMIDGKPGLALHYNAENPFPWTHIIDELRQLDPGTYLGMTYLKYKPLHKIYLPFLLQFQEDFNGL